MQMEMRKNRKIIEIYPLITYAVKNKFLNPLYNIMLDDK